MGLAIDFLGFRYDEADGSFLRIEPGWLWHRPSKHIYDAAGINKAMAAAQYTAGANEIKRNDALVKAELSGFDPANAGFTGGHAGAGGAAITATITGTGTTTIAIDIGGGPAAAPGKLDFAGVAVDGTAITIARINISTGATAQAIATKVQAAVDGAQDAGGTITLHAAVATNGTTVNVTQTGAAGAGNFDAGATGTVS